MPDPDNLSIVWACIVGGIALLLGLWPLARIARRCDEAFAEFDAFEKFLARPNVATWQPAQPGDTPGALVPGEGDVPVDADLMAVAEHLDVDPEPTHPEPTARYQPCDHEWHNRVDTVYAAGTRWCPVDCDGHRCTRLPGPHDRHVCGCGAEDHTGLVLVVDPPVVPGYISRAVVPAPLIGAAPASSPQPDDETWVTFRGYRVHRVCLAGSLRGHAVRDTCAAHLDKAGVA